MPEDEKPQVPPGTIVAATALLLGLVALERMKVTGGGPKPPEHNVRWSLGISAAGLILTILVLYTGGLRTATRTQDRVEELDRKVVRLEGQLGATLAEDLKRHEAVADDLQLVKERQAFLCLQRERDNEESGKASGACPQ